MYLIPLDLTDEAYYADGIMINIKLDLNRLIDKAIAILDQPSVCTEAFFVGLLIFLFVSAVLEVPVSLYSAYAAFACGALTVVSHIFSGFRPEFCMNRKETNIETAMKASKP